MSISPLQKRSVPVLDRAALEAMPTKVLFGRLRPALDDFVALQEFGPIRVAQLLATVVSPHRFRTKRQFWSYCGLAVVTHSSSDWVRDDKTKTRWRRSGPPLTRGLNRARNRVLKDVFKSAATTVTTQPETPLGREYARLVGAGAKPNLARLTIARRIAAIALALWKHNEEYNPMKDATQDS